MNSSSINTITISHQSQLQTNPPSESNSTSIFHRIRNVVESIFNNLADLQKSAFELVNVLKNFEAHTLDMIRFFTKSDRKLDKISAILRSHIGVAGFVQAARGFDYFISKGFWHKEEMENQRRWRDHLAVITGNMAAFVADFGGCVLGIESMGFYNLSQVAARVGKVRVFGFVPVLASSLSCMRQNHVMMRAAQALGELRLFSFVTKISLVSVTLRALDLMNACFAIDAFHKIITSNDAQGKIGNGLYLSGYLLELTISGLLLAGVTNIVGLGVIASASIAVELAAFFYRNACDKARAAS